MRAFGVSLVATALACSGTYALAISPTSVFKRGDYEPVPQAMVDQWIEKNLCNCCRTNSRSGEA
ncbi:hypothetical protein DM02DRAFT_654370 [Periconia macrospinosa]|uniref:Uncharacterized protein n=1 Tax=Periconia macrospinosa TaxID=97972 RepID=A0A2V1DUA2_9PLEO|nr:hypothetical protein DM02DRAFT_654370 [Periconia macrospinosa]